MNLRQVMLERGNNAGAKPRACGETASSGAETRSVGLDQG